MSLWSRLQYRQRRRDKQCVQCGVHTGGPSKCPAHANENAKRLRDLRAQRKADGVCTTCTVELAPPQPGEKQHTLCAGCREDLADRIARLYERRGGRPVRRRPDSERTPDAAPLPTAIVVQRNPAAKAA